MKTCERCTKRSVLTYHGHGYRFICGPCVHEIDPQSVIYWQGWRV